MAMFDVSCTVCGNPSSAFIGTVNLNAGIQASVCHACVDRMHATLHNTPEESTMSKDDSVNHPPYYGGADNPYEAIRVIEAWDLGFHLGSAVKYIARAGKKGDIIEDLKKAQWYIEREIAEQTWKAQAGRSQQAIIRE